MVESLKALDPKWPIREADITDKLNFIKFQELAQLRKTQADPNVIQLGVNEP